jgi:hypothetical protein
MPSSGCGLRHPTALIATTLAPASCSSSANASADIAEALNGAAGAGQRERRARVSISRAM